MRKTRVKQLKKDLSTALKRSPTKSEFRKYKKNRDIEGLLQSMRREMVMSPEAKERILRELNQNMRK